MSTVIVDVREKDEYDAEHAPHSIHIPLSDFDRAAPPILRSLRDRPILLMCRSGKRADLARGAIARLGLGVDCEVYSGGILEWKRQGQPTVASRKDHLPILRQVQLIAGLLALTGAVLAYTVNPGFIFLSGFVGLGLTVAGATGFCGMAEILARMPWNRAHAENSAELCEASPSSGACARPETERSPS